MIERLRQLVETKSLSREEDEIADLVSRMLHDAGLDVQREGNNVWCTVGDRERPRLLLNSHLDTVPPGEGWTADPWTLREVDGRLVGLGANDAKGCVTALIEAVLAIRQRLDAGAALGGTVVLALTAEEENTGAGLGTVLDRLGPLDAGIVGEPTDLTPMIAQRGLLILRCIAGGRSAHPANTPPEVAENAIVTAARDIARLSDFDWGATHTQLGRCHANVTTMTGGVARNVIPDRCEFTLDIRTTPLEDHASLTRRLAAVLESELVVHSDRLVPIGTAPTAAIVRAVSRALPEAVPAGSPAMSDMVFLNGIPAVKIGPGHSPRSHTPNEYIRPEELRAGAAAYEEIIRAYFAEAATEVTPLDHERLAAGSSSDDRGRKEPTA